MLKNTKNIIDYFNQRVNNKNRITNGDNNMDYLIGGVCLGLCAVVFISRAAGGFRND
jgi:hypothetical protein